MRSLNLKWVREENVGEEERRRRNPLRRDRRGKREKSEEGNGCTMNDSVGEAEGGGERRRTAAEAQI